MTAPASKRCPGYAPIGQEPHELPATTEHFHKAKGTPDGLYQSCKRCANAYQRDWQAAKKAGKPFGRKAATAPEAMPKRTYAVIEGGLAPVSEAEAEAAVMEAGRLQGEYGEEQPEPTPEPTLPPATLRVSDPPASPQYADELAREVARSKSRGKYKHYTLEQVGGLLYALPTGNGAVDSEEGQAALQLVNGARAAERRRRDAERKRAERAAAKARAAAQA